MAEEKTNTPSFLAQVFHPSGSPLMRQVTDKRALRPLPAPHAAQIRRTREGRLLAAFLAYGRIERGLSEGTVSQYARNLTRFLRSLGRGKSLLKTKREDVREFLARLNDSTRGAYISALRQFFRFLQLDGQIHEDPTLGIRSPRRWRVLPRT